MSIKTYIFTKILKLINKKGKGKNMSKPGFKRSHKNRKYMGQKYDNFFERRKEFKESAQPPSPIKKPSSRKYSRDSDNYSTSNEDNQPIPFKSKAEDFKTKYKTELCKYFEINGYCKYGENVRI